MKEQEKQIKVSIVKQQFLAESPVDDIKAAQSQVFNIGSGFGHFTFKSSEPAVLIQYYILFYPLLPSTEQVNYKCCKRNCVNFVDQNKVHALLINHNNFHGKMVSFNRCDLG